MDSSAESSADSDTEAPDRGYVSLVIAYRNHDLVREVLRQLEGQSLQPRKVLIADNGGTLSATDLAEMPLADRIELVSLPENPGYGAAVNVARDRLGRDALLVLTHDAVFGSGLAERLLDTLEQGAPTAGCAAPLLRFADNRERVFSAGGLVTAGGRASHLSEPRAAKPYPVAWVDGAIAMYTAAALEAIDWIAEEYFLYFEDVDTGWRLSQHGFESLLVPDEISYQQPGAHPMYLGIRNMVLFARKSGIPRAKNRAAVIRRVARESLGRLRRGKPSGIGEAIRGWRDGNRGLSGKP